MGGGDLKSLNFASEAQRFWHGMPKRDTQPQLTTSSAADIRTQQIRCRREALEMALAINRQDPLATKKDFRFVRKSLGI